MEMKKIVLIVFITFSTMLSFSQTLTFKWETDSLFLKPESALYDSINQIIYVSNINGKYLAKDSNGFISRLKLNGEIDVFKWCTGLDNPQGVYRDWETDRKSTRLNSSHITRSRMPSSA